MNKLLISIIIIIALLPIIYAGLGQETHGLQYTIVGSGNVAGVIINVTNNLTLINITKYSPDTSDRVSIFSVNGTGHNQTLLQRGYFTGDSANVSLNLTAGLEYIIATDVINDTAHTIAYTPVSAITFPINGINLNWVNSSWNGLRNGNGYNIWNIYSLTYTNNILGPNQTYYNSSSYQTSRESILSNWTLDVAPSSATMYYNGTSSTSTITNLQNNIYTFSNSLDIPSSQGPAGTFYWNITYPNGTVAKSNSFVQSVGAINLSLCAAPNNITYLNITFKNETSAQERINASVPTSTWYYWLGGGVENKTFTYSTSTENKEYSWCFTPVDKSVKTSYSFSYDNTESEQRTYEASPTLSNLSTSTILYLLPSNLGQFVTFQVINTAEQAIEGVTVVASRSGIGTIETKDTDASGSATLFMNPNFAYSLTFSKSGLTDFTTTITPTQTSYTITMGGSTTTNNTNPQTGISYSVYPLPQTLNNNTVYNFNFTLNSSYWTLDSWGFTLTNKSGFLLATDTSSVSSGGFLSRNLDTGLNKTIVMNYFWVIDGEYNNASRSWGVVDLSDSGFSFFQLFTDLRTYVSLGFFGLDNFGLALITFLAIFMITGITSYRFGINSPAAIMALVFSLVLFFDFGLGLVPNPAGAIPHAATFLIAIIFVGMIIREVGR